MTGPLEDMALTRPMPRLRARVRQPEGVRVELGDEQWHEVGLGRLLGPDERRYSRRTARTKRKDAERLLTDGAPLVLFHWAGGRLEWFDGVDAQEQWTSVRADVVSTEPRRRGDIEWTAGRWEDEEGQPLLVLTGHC